MSDKPWNTVANGPWDQKAIDARYTLFCKEFGDPQSSTELFHTIRKSWSGDIDWNILYYAYIGYRLCTKKALEEGSQRSFILYDKHEMRVIDVEDESSILYTAGYQDGWDTRAEQDFDQAYQMGYKDGFEDREHC